MNRNILVGYAAALVGCFFTLLYFYAIIDRETFNLLASLYVVFMVNWCFNVYFFIKKQNGKNDDF